MTDKEVLVYILKQCPWTKPEDIASYLLNSGIVVALGKEGK